MRNLVIIATISFFVSCGGTAGGPETRMKLENNLPRSVELDVSDSPKTTYTYQLGPFDLASGNTEMIDRPERLNFDIENPIWMTTFKPSIEDAEGNELPSEIVHQIILVNHGEENSFCTASQTGNPFAAATSNLEQIDLPEDHGYPILPGDPLEAIVTLKNHTDNDHRNVYVKFTISGYPINGSREMQDVVPMMVDIDPCSHGTISIAPRQFIEKTATVLAPKSGSIVQAYGLLQNYGVATRMNTKGGDPFWEGLAAIDEDYKIIELPPFNDAAGIGVSRGDELGLTVAYDNISENWYDEATAAAIVYMTNDESEGRTHVKSAIAVQRDLL